MPKKTIKALRNKKKTTSLDNSINDAEPIFNSTVVQSVSNMPNKITTNGGCSNQTNCLTVCQNDPTSSWKNWKAFSSPPGYACTNSPLESFNATIKRDFTHRCKLGIFAFIGKSMDIIRYYSIDGQKFSMTPKPTSSAIKLGKSMASWENFKKIYERTYLYKDCYKTNYLTKNYRVTLLVSANASGEHKPMDQGPNSVLKRKYKTKLLKSLVIADIPENLPAEHLQSSWHKLNLNLKISVPIEENDLVPIGDNLRDFRLGFNDLYLSEWLSSENNDPGYREESDEEDKLLEQSISNSNSIVMCDELSKYCLSNKIDAEPFLSQIRSIASAN
ncbi:unnamed protein product [Brachionus calyciflorus]|uniref:Uncharacterized protein n=1 Tax=Brachionus calyciflorus TaxID=104777 RepID=A0A813S413_9BILA|nr:unnamed protein product [Brachionus calyciflorus]